MNTVHTQGQVQREADKVANALEPGIAARKWSQLQKANLFWC